MGSKSSETELLLELALVNLLRKYRDFSEDQLVRIEFFFTLVASSLLWTSNISNEAATFNAGRA